MQKKKRVLSFLITMLLLIASVDSTTVRFELTHRNTLFPKPLLSRVEDIINHDQTRHSLISQNRKFKGGVKIPLGSGIDFGTAQYFTEVRVGTPAKKFRVVVDTGSELTWVNCRYRERGKGKLENRRVFRAQESKTFTTVRCFTQTCKVDLMNLFSLTTCPTPSTPCSYDYRYADGSAAQGVFAKETLTVDLTNGRKARLHGLLIGCSSSFSGQSFQGADGVLGLAFSDFSFTSTATNLFGAKFSYCLVDHLSHKNVSNYLIFGSSASSTSTKAAPSRTTPLVLNLLPPFYAINVIGISIGDDMLDIPPQVWDATAGGGTILDSGTSLTLLAEAAYKPVVKGLERYIVELKRVKPEGLPIEYCFSSTSGFNESKLPQLTFHLRGGACFEPHRKSYLVDVAAGVKCLGFMSAGMSATNVVGNIMQQNYLWEFDLRASLTPALMLDGHIALSIRGNCAFTEKAKHAEAVGASALLVINDKEVKLLLYAPNRLVVDLTAGLLLLMAIGTVVIASLLSDLTDPDQANESYSILAKVSISSSHCLVFSIGSYTRKLWLNSYVCYSFIS